MFAIITFVIIVAFLLIDVLISIIFLIIGLPIGLFARKKRKIPNNMKPVEQMSGIEYEYYVAKRLQSVGCTNIEITPPSGDFGADVLATNKDGVRFAVQCKKFSGVVGIEAVQQVLAGQQYYRCQRAMVVTTSHFTPAAKRLAERTGVHLWENCNDYDWIDHIEEYDAGVN